jgi:hypothetical protein
MLSNFKLKPISVRLNEIDYQTTDYLSHFNVLYKIIMQVRNVFTQNKK